MCSRGGRPMVRTRDGELKYSMTTGGSGLLTSVIAGGGLKLSVIIRGSGLLTSAIVGGLQKSASHLRSLASHLSASDRNLASLLASVSQMSHTCHALTSLRNLQLCNSIVHLIV